MRTSAIVNTAMALPVFTLVLGIMTANADDFTWAGSSGDWNSEAHWLPGANRIPELATGLDSATIGSGAVTYTPGGDWINNGVVTISGKGSWTQAQGSVDWIRIGNGEGNAGELIIKGGTFNAGSSEMVIVGADGGTGKIDLSAGGSLVAKGVLIQSGTITVSGKDSSLNVSGELQLRGNGVVASVSEGTLNIGLLSLNDTTDADVISVISFSGGRINVTADELQFDGIYTENNNDYIDFTEKAAGVLFLKHGLLANAEKLLREGRVRNNGATEPGAFSINETPDGVEISVR